MKRFVAFLFLLVSGCIVQSFHEFYTDKNKTTLPEAVGEWNLISIGGDNVADKYTSPWVVNTDDERNLLAYDERNQPGLFRLVFFKVGNRLYGDLQAAGLSEQAQPNAFWVLHTRPVHAVYQTTITNGTWTLTPLSYRWLTKAIEAKEITLPHMTERRSDDFPLFTASPAEWEQFLTKYGASTNAFSPAEAYVLKKHSAKPAPPEGTP